MLDTLLALEDRFLEVRDQLTRPEIASDMNQFQKLNKEYKKLETIVNATHEYRNILDNIKSTKEMLSKETDPEMKEMAREELEILEPRLEEVESEIKIMLIPQDPEDSNNVILEIRAGAGGDEACLFAQDIFRMYEYFCESQKWKMTINEVQDGKTGGYSRIIATIEGEDAYGIMKYESGVHRVQRVPATESQGRIHTSAVSVACMPEMEEVDMEINDADLRIDTFRASGAGGQHVNKTESAIRITHIPTGTVVQNQDQKSQLKNKTKAMKILKSRLYDVELMKKKEAQSRLRKTYVSTGDRSAKIRTYNYPQGRVTDHRIGLTLYKLQAIMGGDIIEIIDALRMAENAEKMKEGTIQEGV